MAGIHPFVPILVVALGVTVGLAVLAWRNRSTTGARWFLGFMIGAMIWLAAETAAALAPVPEPTLTFNRFVYLGVCLMVAGWFLFTLEYTHNADLVTKRLLGVLAIEPLLFLSVSWLRPVPLVWEEITVSSASVSGLEVAHGPAFWLHATYSYVLLLVGLVLLLRMILRSQRLYRGQVIALTVAVLVPIVANALYLLGPIAHDLTPLTFVVSGSALSVALFRYRLTDVTPIAREAVLEKVTDGVLVIDHGRIVDVNPAARSMLHLDGDVVGERAVECLPSGFDLSEDGCFSSGEQDVIVDGEPKIYAVTVSDFGPEDGPPGQIVVLHDITARIQRERELERQNEQLDQFASFVSHDLRNPLNVASGFVDLLGDRYEDDQLNRVDESLDRMETLLDEMLTLARQGQTIESTQPVSIAGQARAAWDVVETGGANLVVADTATVQADPSRLQQVFENLFRNAVEHGSQTPPPGAQEDQADPSQSAVTVTIELIDDGESPAIGFDGFAVVDDGPGVPPGKREQIFEAGETTNRDGTGLGLAIVENVVEAHGWTIDAVGRDGAEGARFEIRNVTAVRHSDGDPSGDRASVPSGAS
ncbi:MAG: signal transduction histidine kinase [Halobacteriales archaeon]|jgi:signal transduction histidine kinase